MHNIADKMYFMHSYMAKKLTVLKVFRLKIVSLHISITYIKYKNAHPYIYKWYLLFHDKSLTYNKCLAIVTTLQKK